MKFKKKLHLRQTPSVYNTYMYVSVFYYCVRCIINVIFASCCHPVNTNENEYNHCYLHSLGGRHLCRNFELNDLVTF